MKDGCEFVGELERVDNNVNHVLNISLKSDNYGHPETRYGKVLIRGSYIAFVSVDYGRVAPEHASKAL